MHIAGEVFLLPQAADSVAKIMTYLHAACRFGVDW